jgi:ubiquinone/menaquinone biosynthesis C-methylase UbiE
VSSYLDRHAELYDVFYADKPYAAETAFVAELLGALEVRPPARLLELACGTGRHAREFERLGYAVLATDYSKDMLACARRRAAEVGSKVAFVAIERGDRSGAGGGASPPASRRRAGARVLARGGDASRL